MNPEQLLYLATVVLTLALIGAGIAWQMRKEEQRGEQLRAHATTKGLHAIADEHAQAWLGAQLCDPSWFLRGDGGRLDNLFHGRIGQREVAVFESHFFRGQGRARDDFGQSVVALRVPAVHLPPLILHPREWRPGLVRVIGAPMAQELPEPSAPAGGNYRAYCASAPLLEALLAGPLGEQLGARAGWWLEARGSCLFACRLGLRPEVAQLEAHCQEAVALLELVIAQASALQAGAADHA